MYVCVQVYKCTHVHLCGGQETTLGIILQMPGIFFFKAVFFTGLELSK